MPLLDHALVAVPRLAAGCQSKVEARTAPGRGCVKTSFNSKFAANLPDFGNLQLSKALISLKLKFGQLGSSQNLIRPLTFLNSLDPNQTSACGDGESVEIQSAVLAS
jgi:hypothetical protein